MSATMKKKSVDYGADEQAMQSYMVEGKRRALALDNRGPIRYTKQGDVHPDILASYWEHGFYVFEKVMRPKELEDIDADLQSILERLPTHEGSPVDHEGRPALAHGLTAKSLYWSKPLGDPFGGTAYGKGRHPVKMLEPKPAKDAPREIVYLILGSLQFSDACVRTYGHPDLLKIAAAVNGDDFVPYTDGLFIKAPGLGASVAWHQDGVTHWDSPTWDQGCHGFNFMGQLYGCTPANGVWVVPGSHKLGHIDIKARVAEAGTERLPDAVPMVCGPGDVVISNRQLLHGSFANTSKDWRVTVNMGFLPKKSVIGVKGGGIVTGSAVYDQSHIDERSKAIGYAIDARRQYFADETPFVYQPFVERGVDFQWNAEAKAYLQDYNRLDISI
ncbi:MAG: phytanoyl-CoA dioxygenase family protein [Pseudomonadota bacterium]